MAILLPTKYRTVFLVDICHHMVYTCTDIYMLCTKFGFGPSENFTAQSVDQGFNCTTILGSYIQSSGFSCATTVVCKVRIYIIHGCSSWATHTDTKVAHAILDWNYYGGCQINWSRDAGYVCSGPALWILGSFWSRSWPPKQSDC